MLIFNKKRMMFLFMAVFLPVGIFMFQVGNNNLNKMDRSVATMSIPVTNRTIVIDAGHRSEKMVVQ